jgi:hypothetical protein
MWFFIAGFLIGGFFGILAMAMLQINKRDD